MTTSNTIEGLNGSENIFFTIGDCSLGSILVAQSERGVCSILIGEDPMRGSFGAGAGGGSNAGRATLPNFIQQE